MSEIGTCGGCRWFSPFIQYRALDGCGNCARITKNEGEQVHILAPFNTPAVLVTHERFGCELWEASAEVQPEVDHFRQLGDALRKAWGSPIHGVEPVVEYPAAELWGDAYRYTVSNDPAPHGTGGPVTAGQKITLRPATGRRWRVEWRPTFWEFGVWWGEVRWGVSLGPLIFVREPKPEPEPLFYQVTRGWEKRLETQENE